LPKPCVIWVIQLLALIYLGSEITNKLISHGINTTIGHDLENSKKADLIIYSAAIKEDDPEIIIANENSVPLIGRGAFVGYLTKLYKQSICISGTHGKTTATSMISICFINAEKDPSIEVGAILKNIDGNYRIGNSEYFILEACEYMGNFLRFHPKTEIVLNIDNDHLDYFKTFDNIVKTFRDFTTILDETGLLVVNADDKNCLDLTHITKSKFITYGITNIGSDFIAKNISFDNNGFATFDVFKNNEFYSNIYLSVAGTHNILNALACIATCDYYGIGKEVISSSLKEFTGASRRLEYKGSFNNASIFDDYGHHPTEIFATISAIKNKKYNKSWVIFQPHTYSRTKTHLEEFSRALMEFDNIIVVDIYSAREQNTIGISSKDLVAQINSLGKNAIYVPDFNDVVKHIKENVQPNDLVLTLGAGTVTEIGGKICQ